MKTLAITFVLLISTVAFGNDNTPKTTTKEKTVKTEKPVFNFNIEQDKTDVAKSILLRKRRAKKVIV